MAEGRKPKTRCGDTLARRTFLKFVGAGSFAAAGCSTSPRSGETPARAKTESAGDWVLPGGEANWSPPAYPMPLPGDHGSEADDASRLATFHVRDELVLPDGFQYHILARWGQVFGAPGHQVRFGYNNDYTGLLPIRGKPGEYWLMVNHEEVNNLPWYQGYASVFGKEPPPLELRRDEKGDVHFAIGDQTFPGDTLDLSTADLNDTSRRLLREVSIAGLEEMGVSVLHVRRTQDGRYHVVEDATDHRRITTISRHNTSEPIAFTGPAAAVLPSSALGTFSNCSGGTTPWGSFFTCEENFQNHVPEGVDDSGQQVADGEFEAVGIDFQKGQSSQIPVHFYGFGKVLDQPLDGRCYGWVCEVVPETGKLTKHTALGRFRHENVATRAIAGRRLACYMGDDRRGGHVWKFVSDDVIDKPDDPANSRLLAKGTLYVAVFEAHFAGRWIPLNAATPLKRPKPENTATGRMKLPNRAVGASGVVIVDEQGVDAWMAQISAYCGKPFEQCSLGDLVVAETTEKKNGIILTDAFAMANAVGGTPAARPEDLEVNPTDQSVYIAFTDTTGESAGSPDKRVFPSSIRATSNRYGSIFRLVEDEASGDGEPDTFKWGRFVMSGELAEGGGGFACCDNLAFDHAANLWITTDITTSAQNHPVDRRSNRTEPGQKYFQGVFGNNALFMMPTEDDVINVPRLFAVGPCECELTGPTFAPDGRSLILSVQHPGGRHGARTADRPDREATFTLATRQGRPFEQTRTVPVGSNWPKSGKMGATPMPCVVCITRHKA